VRATTTVYVLRFTGFRDKLKSIRNQTDSMAELSRSERATKLHPTIRS
jgi:hypothetical protein